MISVIGWETTDKIVWNTLERVGMNCGKIVIALTRAKISQLRQSIKLTGVIRHMAAAAMSPSTAKRNIRIVRVK